MHSPQQFLYFQYSLNNISVSSEYWPVTDWYQLLGIIIQMKDAWDHLWSINYWWSSQFQCTVNVHSNNMLLNCNILPPSYICQKCLIKTFEWSLHRICICRPLYINPNFLLPNIGICISPKHWSGSGFKSKSQTKQTDSWLGPHILHILHTHNSVSI